MRTQAWDTRIYHWATKATGDLHMRTKRSDPMDRAVSTPLPATRSRSERRFASLTVSCTRRRRRDRRRHRVRDQRLALRPIRRTRAAHGDSPGRLFSSRKGMDQMPGRDPMTKAPGRPGERSAPSPRSSVPALAGSCSTIRCALRQGHREHDGLRLRLERRGRRGRGGVG